MTRLSDERLAEIARRDRDWDSGCAAVDRRLLLVEVQRLRAVEAAAREAVSVLTTLDESGFPQREVRGQIDALRSALGDETPGASKCGAVWGRVCRDPAGHPGHHHTRDAEGCPTATWAKDDREETPGASGGGK